MRKVALCWRGSIISKYKYDNWQKTLKDKIAAYHTDVDTIDEYLDEPVGPIDWENDYEAGEARLKASLEKLKAKD